MKNDSNKIVLGVLSIFALLLSIPLEWMTIHGAKLQFQGEMGNFMGNMFSQGFGGITLTLTGLNGNITFLVKLPIWLIVVIGLIGVVLSLLNSLRITSLPRGVLLIPLFLSAIYMIIGLFVGLVLCLISSVTYFL